MAYTAEQYAAAVWDYTPRTLASGTPAAPSNRAEEYAGAVWAAGSRTLTEAAPVPATGYTLAGPASGRVGSARTFTISAVGGVFVGTEVVTPVNTGLTGSFSAATVTPAAGSSSVTFTFTGSAVSSGTIGATDNKGWTDPAAIAFTVVEASMRRPGGMRLGLGLGLR